MLPPRATTSLFCLLRGVLFTLDKWSIALERAGTHEGTHDPPMESSSQVWVPCTGGKVWTKGRTLGPTTNGQVRCELEDSNEVIEVDVAAALAKVMPGTLIDKSATLPLRSPNADPKGVEGRCISEQGVTPRSHHHMSPAPLLPPHSYSFQIWRHLNIFTSQLSWKI